MKKNLIIITLSLILAGAGCNTAGNQAATKQPEINIDNNIGSDPADTTTENTSTETRYTMDEVKTANNENKCWTAIDGTVYDLTPIINQHPGGKATILMLCGKDGTKAFNMEHGGQKKAINMLKGLEIGKLK